MGLQRFLGSQQWLYIGFLYINLVIVKKFICVYVLPIFMNHTGIDKIKEAGDCIFVNKSEMVCMSDELPCVGFHWCRYFKGEKQHG